MSAGRSNPYGLACIHNHFKEVSYEPKKYIDPHTHTRFSDGQLTPQELIERAKSAGIGTLAITDHNMIIPNLDELREANPDMGLITASEISCRYITADGRALRDALRELADSYGLLYSAASDFHGQNSSDSLDNQFLCEIWENLRVLCEKR